MAGSRAFPISLLAASLVSAVLPAHAAPPPGTPDLSYVCVFGDTTSPDSLSGPPQLPSHGAVRCLLVFIRFRDDTLDVHDCQCGGWSYRRWEDRLPPMFADSLLSPFPRGIDSTFVPGSVTDYFETMSRGALWVYGDVFNNVHNDTMLVMAPRTSAEYDSLGWDSGEILRELVEMVIDPAVDFAEYDNLPDSTGGDGEVDMLITVYRRGLTGFQPVFGFAGLEVDIETADSTTMDGVRVPVRIDGSAGFGSGTWIRDNAVWNRPQLQAVICHEIGHHLFSRDMRFLGRGHLPAGSQFSLMAGDYMLCGNAMSGFEKWRLGWVEPDTIAGDTIIVIGDGTTTGELYLVNLPPVWGTARDDSLFFLLENRQRISIYDCGPSYDYSSCNSDFPCVSYRTASSGLLIWQGSYAYADSGRFRRQMIDIESAYGLYEDRTSGPSLGRVDRRRGFDKIDREHYVPGSRIDTTRTYRPESNGNAFTPYTNPSSDEWRMTATDTAQDVATGVSVYDVEYADAESLSLRVRVAFGQPRDAVTRGTTWSGRVVLEGDVTVAAGDTLRVRPRTAVVLAQERDLTAAGVDTTRAELIVAGSLVATAQEAGDILWNAHSVSEDPAGRGDWYGIRSAAGARILLDGAAIHNAWSAVSAVDPQSVRVENVSISNSARYGVRLVHGPSGGNDAPAAVIRDSSIHSTGTPGGPGAGIGLEGVSARVEGNVLELNFPHEVYVAAPGS